MAVGFCSWLCTLQNDALMAYQVAFDLHENQNYAFLTRVSESLPSVAGDLASDGGDVSAAGGASSSSSSSSTETTTTTAIAKVMLVDCGALTEGS